MRLDAAPEVSKMATDLGLESGNAPVAEIVRHCTEKLSQWVAEAGGAQCLDRVQEIACERLQLVFEEIYDDSDLDRIMSKYVAMGELGFASLKFQLNDDTFATLMERHRVKHGAKDRYVAIIDCRGAKSARRYFTRWHEIAHLLTLVGQLELPFHRSTVEQNPIEKLMDVIAGEVGFYGPVFEPAVALELAAHGAIGFDGVQRIRDSVCPAASFQATLIATVKRSSLPMVLLEVGLGYKKEEQNRMNSQQLIMFSSGVPTPHLRAIKAVPNPVAKDQRFIIHQNMKIPSASLITKYCQDNSVLESAIARGGKESLSIWRHSDGVAIGQGHIHIEVMKASGTTYAIVRKLGFATWKGGPSGTLAG